LNIIKRGQSYPNTCHRGTKGKPVLPEMKYKSII
jgi:hypothetical protein